jgi:hypothetical protein
MKLTGRIPQTKSVLVFSFLISLLLSLHTPVKTEAQTNGKTTSFLSQSIPETNSATTVTLGKQGRTYDIKGLPEAAVLNLSSNRFQVWVNWKNYNNQATGTGTAIPLTDETGYFWFFNSSNVELIIKILNGQPINGCFWVMYGALSDVEYTISILDTQTGKVKTYFNPAHTLASYADIYAFGTPLGGLREKEDFGAYGRLMSATSQSRAKTIPAEPLPPDNLVETASSGCSPSPTNLCLNGNRFEVKVNWRNYNDGSTGTGKAVALTGETGYFWFFSSSNVELVIKVLDGHEINNYFWVMYGALSDVEYTIVLTDTQTGRVKTYFNPPNHLASNADVTAFSWSATPTTTTTTTTLPVKGPKPGFWNNPRGIDFYVSPDRSTAMKLNLYVYVAGCGSFTITKNSTPIYNDGFEVTDTYYIKGRFTSETTAEGIYGLLRYNQPGCGYLTGGAWNWTASWESNAQPPSSR